MTTTNIISLSSVIVATIAMLSTIYFKNKANSKDDISISAIMENNLKHLIEDVKDIKETVKEINKKLNYNSEEISRIKEQVKTLFDNQKDLKSRVKDLEHERNNEKS